MHRTHVILLHGDSGDVGHGLHAELQQGLPRLLLAAAVLGSGLTIRPDLDLIIGLGLGLLLVLVDFSVDFAHLCRGLQTPMQIARVDCIGQHRKVHLASDNKFFSDSGDDSPLAEKRNYPGPISGQKSSLRAVRS
jgi:hypothetical protein